MQKISSHRSPNYRYIFTHLTLHGKGEFTHKTNVTAYYKHVDPNDILTGIFGKVLIFSSSQNLKFKFQ